MGSVDLAARPEYAEPLREEITEVLGTGHEVTKASLAKLKKMDSFIRVRKPHSSIPSTFTYTKNRNQAALTALCSLPPAALQCATSSFQMAK
jgi:hypothetical protein